MLINLVYYSTQPNIWLEDTLGAKATVSVSSGQDRRTFLVALSEAVGASNTVIAIGSVSDLTTALSKGLGLPLEPVDWDRLGFKGGEEIMLPKSALPLIVDGSVYGMIFESGEQCIIAIDDDSQAIERLCTTYVLPYIDAVCSGTHIETNSAEKVASDENADSAHILRNKDGIQDSGEVDAAGETDADEEVISSDTEEYNTDTVANSEPDADRKNSGQDGTKAADYDIFADMSDSDVDLFLHEPKKKKALPVVITVIAILVALAVAAYFVYPLAFGAVKGKQYYSEAMKNYGKTGDSAKLPDAFNSTYLTRFGALYLINPDVIGVLKINDLHINLPIVTGASKDKGYYEKHRFDGRTSPAGTLYTPSAYGENSVNPNLIIYGNNIDGMFAGLETLLDNSVSSKLGSITTDSILYGEDKWNVFSVMLLDGTDEFNYTDNFSSLSAEERVKAVKKALSLSKVDLGFKDSDFDNVGLSSNFLTLVTSYSKDKSKKVVVMARIESDAFVYDETTESESSGDESGEPDVSIDSSSQPADQAGNQEAQ